MLLTDLFVAAINFVKTNPQISPEIQKRDMDPNLLLGQVVCRAIPHQGELGFYLEVIFDYQFKNNSGSGQPDMIIKVLPLAKGGFVLI